MNTTVIDHGILSNLIRNMSPMKQRAMELLNKGKDRRWAYWVIWVVWLILMPCSELVCRYTTENKTLILALPFLISFVYAAMLLLYVKVKIWEKEHRSSWDEILRNYRQHCLLLRVSPTHSPEMQIRKIETDLASLVDELIAKQEKLRTSLAEELRLKARGGESEKKHIAQEVSALEAQRKQLFERLKREIDTARDLFAGDFEDATAKYILLFRLGITRYTDQQVVQEATTRYGFPLRR